MSYYCSKKIKQRGTITGMIYISYEHPDFIKTNKNNLCLDFKKKWLAKENKIQYCKDCKYFKNEDDSYV